MLYNYNGVNDKCPVPLVNLRVILKKMSCNDSCLIQIADEGSKKDIPKLLTKQNVQFTQHWLNETVLELLITKT
jgi:TusA-related sulfurtransferase